MIKFPGDFSYRTKEDSVIYIVTLSTPEEWEEFKTTVRDLATTKRIISYSGPLESTVDKTRLFIIRVIDEPKTETIS